MYNNVVNKGTGTPGTELGGTAVPANFLTSKAGSVALYLLFKKALCSKESNSSRGEPWNGAQGCRGQPLDRPRTADWRVSFSIIRAKSPETKLSGRRLTLKSSPLCQV
jgi:hypothetical protein